MFIHIPYIGQLLFNNNISNYFLHIQYFLFRLDFGYAKDLIVRFVKIY